MNDFVRQLATLAAVWALCELLLPNRRQQMIRLAVTLMVMVALITSLGRLLKAYETEDWPVFVPAEPAHAADGYQRMVLTSMANQAEQVCLRTAQKAGYGAQAAVYLNPDGSAARIQLYLFPLNSPPLMEGEALSSALAQLLGVDAGRISWEIRQEGAMP